MKALRRIGAIATVCSLLAAANVLGADDASARIVLTPRPAPDATFEVRGLSKDALKRAAEFSETDARWTELFAVRVGSDSDADQPAMLGTYSLANDVLRFTPRFPLQSGLSYRATLELSVVSAAVGKDTTLRETFSIPARTDAKPTNLTAIYPSGSKLPENLLKFYLHFSAPMSQGDSYRYLKLLDESGKRVELPFLELPQELWNSEGTRLTVLFDPGRVKRGLKPREDSGPVLVAGRRFTLVIDPAWPDANGHSLTRSVQKTFLATEADTSQPDPVAWKLAPPAAGSREPLVLHFPEPLDHAMLQRVLWVVGPGGDEVEGAVFVGDGETTWRLTPRVPWEAGAYVISVETTLEDRAGNSIGRAFEVDLKQPPSRQKADRFLHIPFGVKPADGADR